MRIGAALIVLTLLGCVRPVLAAPNPGPDACAALVKAIDAQPPGPVFLASYPGTAIPALKDVAFVYDNAVAAIALVACGQREKAVRIGDAMLIAQSHDRYWHDGRLRNAYLAGALSGDTIKLAGWWDVKQNQWVEDRYQVGSDNGNMAWTILALLALDRKTDPRYRDGATLVGTWMLQWQGAAAPHDFALAGFTGGVFGHEPVPLIETWKSTEHNTDIAAAFAGLARATGEARWRAGARDARKFVWAMWSARCKCFDVGTAADGTTHNTYRALDAQIWPLLALPGAAKRYAAAQTEAERELRQDGGFAYSQAREGFWTEGTAQVALLRALSGDEVGAAPLRAAVDAMRAPTGFYYAANTATLPTGFMLDTDPTQPRRYFHIPHLAALAWAALMQRRYDPFTHTDALP